MPREYKLKTGGALALRDYTSIGLPELAQVPAELSRRARFVRTQYLNDHEGEERFCAVFRDPGRLRVKGDERTESWYAQPVAEDE